MEPVPFVKNAGQFDVRIGGGAKVPRKSRHRLDYTLKAVYQPKYSRKLGQSSAQDFFYE
jgi:hypothetical protein